MCGWRKMITLKDHWEQKTIYQALTTIFTHAFIAVRIWKRSDMFKRAKKFKVVEKYRRLLIRVRKCPDFIYNIFPHIFTCAVGLKTPDKDDVNILGFE